MIKVVERELKRFHQIIMNPKCILEVKETIPCFNNGDKVLKHFLKTLFCKSIC